MKIIENKSVNEKLRKRKVMVNIEDNGGESMREMMKNKLLKIKKIVVENHLCSDNEQSYIYLFSNVA